jgi:hypothetical protein
MIRRGDAGRGFAVRAPGGPAGTGAAVLKESTVTAIGKGFVAVLSTNERGPVERRRARTRMQAFAAARMLLAVAERRDFNRGEIVAVDVRQVED